MHIFPGHTAVDSLYLSTDHAVDPQLLAAARRIDAEAFAREAPRARVKRGRVRVKPHIAETLMAEEIIRIAASQGCVTLDDFRRLGLDDAQIEAAKASACGQAILRRPALLNFLQQMV